MTKTKLALVREAASVMAICLRSSVCVDDRREALRLILCGAAAGAVAATAVVVITPSASAAVTDPLALLERLQFVARPVSACPVIATDEGVCAMLRSVVR